MKSWNKCATLALFFFSGCSCGSSVFDGNLQLSLQLQSNLIPGLNLNALGLFPSGSPGMGPSMSSVPPPGAHGGCSFGVSCSPCRDTPLTRSGVRLPEAELLQEPGNRLLLLRHSQVLSFMFVFFFSAVLMGLRGHFGLL